MTLLGIEGYELSDVFPVWKHCSPFRRDESRKNENADVPQIIVKVLKGMFGQIWRFPKIGVPPDHPF